MSRDEEADLLRSTDCLQDRPAAVLNPDEDPYHSI